MGVHNSRLNSYNYSLTYKVVREKILNGSLNVNAVPVQKFIKNVDTYLQYAVKIEDEIFIDGLLKTSVDINANSKNCHPALHLAVMANNSNLVTKLLDANADINLQSQYEVEHPSCELLTPLQLATKYSYYDIAELLINRGANVNACCSNVEEHLYITHPTFIIRRNAILPNTLHHFTPLHIAVNNEKEEIVDLLIRNGADINNSPKCNSMFVLHATSKTALGIAVKKKNLVLVKKLVDAGADVNISSYNEYWTPLHLAAELDEREIALYLIRKNANVNAISNITLGYSITTPLRVAIKNNHLEMVKLLVKHGALINFQVNNFLCPILYCIFTHVKSKEMLGYLLDCGADMIFDWPVQERTTFLHYVASMNDNDLMSFLLTHKYMIDINTVTSKGESVLHKAVQSIYESNAIHLLNADINVDLVDTDGNTAHDIAYECNQYSYKTIIERHIVKLIAARISVSQKNFKAVQDTKYDHFYNECRQIVAVMKKTNIPGSNLTYYQLLRYPVAKSARMLEDLNVETHEFFFFANRFADFTRYSEMLWYRKVKVKQRIPLLKKAEKRLCKVMSDIGLEPFLRVIPNLPVIRYPENFCRDLTDNLSYRDLELLNRS